MLSYRSRLRARAAANPTPSRRRSVDGDHDAVRARVERFDGSILGCEFERDFRVDAAAPRSAEGGAAEDLGNALGDPGVSELVGGDVGAAHVPVRSDADGDLHAAL